MKIANFKQLDPPVGALVAKFDVDFGPVTVRGFSVFSKDGRRWINEPAERWTDRDGKDRWHKHAVVSDQFVMSNLVAKIRDYLGGVDAPAGGDDDITF